MITETAKVIDVDDDIVTIESEIKSSCSGCQQVDTCGSGQVAKAFPQKHACFKTKSDLPLKIGDKVLIGIEEKNLLTTAWQVYMWPLIGLILGAAVGQQLVSRGIFQTELLVIVFGFSGCYMGFRLAKFWQSYSHQDKNLQPKILKIVPNSISVTQID